MPDIKQSNEDMYTKKEVMNRAVSFFDGDQMAADTWSEKYALQLPEDQVKDGKKFLEKTPKEMWARMAKEGAKVEGENQEYWEQQFYNIFEDFTAVPQGSIMFAMGNEHQDSSLSNCFVLPIEDDNLEEIFETSKRMARTYSYRGGVGTDITILRPKDSVVHNAARQSTGAVSFMDFYSYVTNLIGQKSRRGALMLTISDKHPDLYNPEADGMDFINIKRDLDKVTGANISIKFSDAFMEAVQNDEQWVLKWERVSDEIYVGEDGTREFVAESEGPDISIRREYLAQEIWDNVVESATECAEPGVIFWDKMKNDPPYGQYEDHKPLTTNPCCFSKEDDIDVLTKGGIKDLQDVEQNDEVWVDTKQKWCKTSGYFEQGRAEVFRVEFKNGQVFHLTENHKLEKYSKPYSRRVNKELVKLENLEEGDRISVNSNKPKDMNFGNKGTYEEGKIMGWLSGDGTLSFKESKDVIPTMFLQFWPDDHELAKEYEGMMGELGYTGSISEYENNGNTVKRLQSRRFVQDFMEKYEVNPWSFRTGECPFLYEASEDFLKGYISAYFSADGTAQCYEEQSRYNISVASIDKERLKQLTSILSGFGIKSSIGLLREARDSVDFDDGSVKNYNTKTCYRLTITGRPNIKKFSNELGFLINKKEEIVDKILDVSTAGKSTCRTDTKIVSIEKAGVHEVGCIEVEEEHRFTANGIISGNSEIPLSPNDACTLLSINLTNFVKHPFSESAEIDYEGLREVARVATRFLDNVKEIDAQKVPFKEQREKALSGRRLGLGFHGLGDMLTMLEVKYDSEEAKEICDELYMKYKHFVYGASADLAEEKGTFPDYDYGKHMSSPFMQRLVKENPDLADKIKEQGLRNCGLLTSAPTGSVSMISQTSSGIEPIFRLKYKRNVRTGDDMKTFDVFHHLVEDYLEKESININPGEINEEELKEILPNYFKTAEDINHPKRAELQGTLQRHMDHALSSTINIPSHLDNLEEVVSDSYFKAWREGCKGYTVYVDNSREDAPLETGEQEPTEVAENMKYKGDTRIWEVEDDSGHYFISEGQDQIFINGYETAHNRMNAEDVNLGETMYHTLMGNVDEGRLQKYSKRAGFDPIERIARLTSLALKTENAGLIKNSFEEYENKSNLAEKLNNIFNYREIEGQEKCPECGSELIHKDGCVECSACHYEKCGI